MLLDIYEGIGYNGSVFCFLYGKIIGPRGGVKHPFILFTPLLRLTTPYLPLTLLYPPYVFYPHTIDFYPALLVYYF